MDKDIPVPPVQTTKPKTQRVLRFQRLFAFFLCCIVVVQSFRFFAFHNTTTTTTTSHPTSPPCCCHPCRRVSHHRREELRAICKNIRTPAGPPQTCACAKRTESDRFVPGTRPVLLRNGMIWTGARNGTEVVYGDVLLDKGLVVAVGYIPPSLLDSVVSQSSATATELRVEDLGGAWVTPGLVDLHSHLGVYSAPSLRGQSFCHFSSLFSTAGNLIQILLFFKFSRCIRQ